LALRALILVERQQTMRAAAWLSACALAAVVFPYQASGQGKIDPAPMGFDQKRENIERGKVETIEYDSKAVRAKRKLRVYLPPGYVKDAKYPVFYLLHGAGDNETGWQQKGAADVILDNLYADKKLVPMIVVMPNGFARKQDAPPRSSVFEEDLLQDIVPYV